MFSFSGSPQARKGLLPHGQAAPWRIAAILPLLAVLALLWSVSVVGNAHAQIPGNTAEIEITPPNPTTSDDISIRLFGEDPNWWQDSCHPREPQVSIVGHLISIDTTNTDPICTQSLSEWETMASIGPLPAGDYDVTVTFQPYPFDGAEIGAASFTVLQGPCVQPPNDIVAWWPLNENSGTTVADIVGGHTGTPMTRDTVINSPTFGDTFPAALGLAGLGPTAVAGMVDGAFAFNGTNQFVKVPSAPALNFGTGDFSIDAWINLTDGSGYRPIVEKRHEGISDAPFGYRFFVEDNKLGFRINTALGLSNISAGITALSPVLEQGQGQWYHVAVTVERDPPPEVNGVAGKLYVDGVVVATFSMWQFIGDAGADNDAALIIGSRNLFFEFPPIPDVFGGKIDEVEIFHRALSQSQIEDIFNAGSSGKCKPPVGGIVELRTDADAPVEASVSSSARDYTAPLAAVAAAGVIAVAAGGWYARRRLS